MTPLKWPKFAKIRLTGVPNEIINEYKLKEKNTTDGWIYIKCIHGIYRLQQSSSLGHDLLEEWLNKEVYFQSKIVPGFWKHRAHTVQYVLTVDDFGIKYTKEEDLHHLIDIFKSIMKYWWTLKEDNTSKII